ncbi:MAG: response regulator transcription factor [Candidatus Kapaibacterium sp.]
MVTEHVEAAGIAGHALDQARLLLVEDDANLGAVLSEFLQLKGYDVTLCTDGEKGESAFLASRFDLCILDVMLPKQDGFSLARRIRARDPHVPILFLTAKSLPEDRLQGFETGADDYVSKPFSVDELMMRIKAILRRTHVPATPSDAKRFTIGDYVFDAERRTLTRHEETRALTHKESELLRILARSAGDVVRRTDALKEIWGDDNYFNGRSMDVFVTRLRKYLKDDPDITIVNVHGTGFKLQVLTSS